MLKTIERINRQIQVLIEQRDTLRATLEASGIDYSKPSITKSPTNSQEDKILALVELDNRIEVLRLERHQILERAKATLNPEQYAVLELRASHIKKYNIREIAKVLNYSERQVYRIIKSINSGR